MTRITFLALGVLWFGTACSTKHAHDPVQWEELYGTYRLGPPTLNGSGQMYLVIEADTLTWHDLETQAVDIQHYQAKRIPGINGYEVSTGGDQLPLWITACNGGLFVYNGIDEEPTPLIPDRAHRTDHSDVR
ncbi:MAG: hypothetical protein AAF085_05200 [Planctomycetota bacterium]